MTPAPLEIIAIGFVLGMRHATDPDHVIAVSTIVSRERSIAKAGWIGALWGCGHTLTIFIVGAAIILLGLVIPARIGLTMEFSVGIMLLLHFPVRSPSPASEHRAESLPLPAAAERSLRKLGLFPTIRPLLVGIVHGLAGSAAVALGILSAIREPRWAVAYLLIFGIGTIAGMMLITAALALPFSFAGYRFGWLNRGIVASSGVISLAFGLFLAYHIGFVDGLFTNHPVWTPR